MITIEQLAEELHKFYRAACKALQPQSIALTSHDHGWSHCNKKKYFIKRAEAFLRIFEESKRQEEILAFQEKIKPFIFKGEDAIPDQAYRGTKITPENLLYSAMKHSRFEGDPQSEYRKPKEGLGHVGND